ncbi:cytochrome-c peroxidase [Burkholderia ubonensis]|uniref:cytochrome-c peroxidase n=1 Tax=Burkholderia ubonensis TaxID=101571 RepID=UPI000754FAE7|nr:cytochrome c peroxidase [Burkholderia ubonensis]KVA14508.1 cytochrome-c peroxidase [Burkholderia ubonensis]KVA25434.1 cytochrome-c peroxidase [Burkholderia ubonensis]KVA35987.1 cytochrome-c peroxidase [Burkholderia ubonensis]
MHSNPTSFAFARSLIHAAAALALAAGLAALAGCDAGPGASAQVVSAAQAAPSSAPAVAPASQPQTRAQVFEGVKQMTALGKQLFFDPSLSGSGKLACASCHSAEHAFGPPNALSVQLGGDDMRRAGFRAVPSLKYLRGIPPFSEHFHDSPDEGDESVDAGPTGGLTWDGRVDTRDAQARIPLTSPFEMSSSPAKVAKAVRAAPYVDAFRKAFGDKVLADDQATFDAVLRALDAFQQQPALFDPYTSKYDAYLAGKAQLTPAELRGLQLFNDERKGNCASCHLSQRTLEGGPPQFSDFGLIAIGVPRNRALPVNRDPRFYDLGACGPERTDLKGRGEFCGLFRTPSLRNVATRKTFFHNGVYHSLEDVMRFYVERDIHPEKFYPVVHGKVQRFDDLPKRYWDNINREPPFDRKPGDQPALNEAEIKDVIAFLNTLTDGYRAAATQASR